MRRVLEKYWTFRFFSFLQAFLGCLIFAVFLAVIIHSTTTILLHLQKQKLRDLVESAYSIVDHYYSLAQKGKLTEAEAQELAKETIKSLKYGPEKKDYFWINSDNPSKTIMIMHPYNTNLVGRDITDIHDKKGIRMWRKMAQIASTQGEGFLRYYWQYKDNKNLVEQKISFVKHFAPWGWVIGTGLYKRDFNEEYYRVVKKIIAGFVVCILLYIGISLFFTSIIIKPIMYLKESLNSLSKGDLRIKFREFGVKEFREIARSLNITTSNLKDLLRGVYKETENMAIKTSNVKESASEVEEDIVGAEKISGEMESFVQRVIESIKDEQILMEQVSQAVQEISENTIKTSEVTSQAVEEAQRSQKIMKDLHNTIEGVNGILKMIEDIANQTNLLALNASIEAARAGEAGKGFAVVANEVKELAKQTTEATKEISQQLKSIKSQSRGALEAVENIAAIIDQVNEGAASVASAIEEHTSVMGEITQRIEQQGETAEEIGTKSAKVRETMTKSVEIVKNFYRDAEELLNATERLKEKAAQFRIE